MFLIPREIESAPNMRLQRTLLRSAADPLSRYSEY